MRTPRLAAAVALVALLAVSGCGSGEDEPEAEPTTTVHGTLAVEATYRSRALGADASEPCKADKGYDDMHHGTQVAVTDADGTTVAVSQLESIGLQPPGEQDTLYTWCGFEFSVDGVPAGSPTYGVKIGNRDVYWVEAADVADGLELSLGSILRR